eukprot:m.1261266 g.1261266  ORF g.1261266 m.1261266 type:complete len:1120 (-) comp24731_c0_seq1:243-3602(-)
MGQPNHELTDSSDKHQARGSGLHEVIWRLLIALALQAIAVYCFTSGFLLTRSALPEISNCSAADDIPDDSVGCYTSRLNDTRHDPPRFKRAVIIIIDALRYDMAEYDAALPDSETPPYKNKLPVLHELQEKYPDRSMLYRFVADAPTTTMQRLKGLTTGGLPTFIDASSNFASTEIMEDNVITKATAHGLNLMMVGDDTWVDLFPRAFAWSAPFPSFDVRDLNTVDNGVKQHLVPLMKDNHTTSNTSRWDLLVGHFLGVDHCGHRYGPNHPAMAVKLHEMDGVLRAAAEALPDDAVLLVMGDHGMTSTGDHGGDSPNELHAALFAYSNQPWGQRPRGVAGTQRASLLPRTVSQIDFAPSLAFMLGLPIPFGSLGSAIAELIAVPAKATTSAKAHVTTGADLYHLDEQYASIARANARQILRYLRTYSAVSNDVLPADIDRLAAPFQTAEELWVQAQNSTAASSSKDTAHLYQSSQRLYRLFIGDVQQYCRQVWATFDLRMIAIGIAIEFGCILFLGVELYRLQRSKLKQLFDAAAAPRRSAAEGLRGHDTGMWSTVAGMLVTMVTGALVGLFGVVCMTTSGQFAGVGDEVRHLTVAATSVSGVLLYSIHVFTTSSSQILPAGVYNAAMQVPGESWIVAVCFVGHICCCLSNSFVVHQDSINAAQIGLILIVMATTAFARSGWAASSAVWHLLVALVVTRLSTVTQKCREEQHNCVQQDLDMTFAYGSLVGFLALHYFWFKQNAVLDVQPARIRLTGVFPLLFLGLCCHWCMEFLDESRHSTAAAATQPSSNDVTHLSEGLRQQGVPLLPSVIDFFGTPTGRNFPARMVYAVTLLNLVLILLYPSFIKITVAEDLPVSATQETAEESSRRIYLQGVLVSMSAPIVTLMSSLMFLLMLVLEMNAVPSVLLFAVQTYAFLRARQDMHLHDAEWSTVGMWFLLTIRSFYMSAHQTTFASIQWTSGLVGLSASHTVVSGTLVAFNTFGFFALMALGVPLLVLWAPIRVLSTDLQASRVGEFWLHSKKGRGIFEHRLGTTSTLYMLMFAVSTLVSMTAAAVHRRHLMVWKIFAPRVIFDCISLLVTNTALVAGMVFLLRVRTWLDHADNIMALVTTGTFESQKEK